MDARRPHLSANKKAGMEARKKRIADTPDAKNDAFEDERPACSKSSGAYYAILESA